LQRRINRLINGRFSGNSYINTRILQVNFDPSRAGPDVYRRNYLAHFYLAKDSPESISGSIPGDFEKGAIGEIKNHYRAPEENFLIFFLHRIHFVANLKKSGDLPA